MEFVAVAVLVVVLFLGSELISRQKRTDTRVRMLERRLERGLVALGVDEEEAHVKAARALIADGSVINAVKLWRDATGASLTEAKRAIDRLKSGTA